MTTLRDNVERWLIHENYKFDEIKTDDDHAAMRKSFSLVQDVLNFSMLTYFPLILGKCDFIAPDCLPLCLAAVCNEVEGRNDISKHCQRHNGPEG